MREHTVLNINQPRAIVEKLCLGSVRRSLAQPKFFNRLDFRPNYVSGNQIDSRILENLRLLSTVFFCKSVVPQVYRRNKLFSYFPRNSESSIRIDRLQ